jgi:transcriptional antiterminator NusG
MKYFVVHTYTGRERRVKQLLETAIEREALQALFGEIIVPAESVVRFHKSKRMVEERKLYPGYIIVEMEPVEEVLKLVNSIPGVTHFLGTRAKPMPLSGNEVAEVLEQIKCGRERIRAEVPFTKGENVKVVSGPFSGFTGTVDETNSERNKVRVLVTIFGRSTPIELDFLEVQTL